MHNKYTQHTHIYNVNKIAWQHYKLHIQILQIIIFTESVSDVYLNKSVMKSSFFKCYIPTTDWNLITVQNLNMHIMCYMHI